MLAFSVREALRQAAAAFGPPGTSVDLASPATPEAVYWAVEARQARRSSEHGHVVEGLPGPGPRPARRRRPPAAPPVGAGRPGGARGGAVMTHWVAAVERLRRERRPGVLVTVTDVRGHAPREAGAKMVVVRRRRRGAASAAATSRRPRWPGPGPLLDAPRRRAGVDDDVAQRQGPHRARPAVLRRRGDAAARAAAAWCPSVAIFGIGHVGLELARILARHDLELHLVDSRADQLAADRLACLDDGPAAVHVHHAPVPELVLGEVPRGTHVLVMTHDHAEDFALCDAALRCAHLGSIGLIGSAAKWRRFQQGLRVEGHAEADDRPDPVPDRRPRRSPARTGRHRARRRRRAAADRSRPSRGRRHDRRSTGPGSLDTPDDPFTGGVLRSDDDAGLLVADGVIRARGDFAAVRADHPDEEVVDLRDGVLLPGSGRHPRPLPAGPRDRRPRHAAARVAGAVRPARGAAARVGRLRPRGRRRSSCSAWSRPAPPPRWSSAPTSRPRSTRSSPRRRGSGCGSPPGSWSATAGSPSRCSRPRSGPTTRRVALAGRWHGARPGAVRRHPAVLLLRRRRDARRLCRRWPRTSPGAWFTSHVNENPAEVAEVARLFAGRRALRRHLRPARPGRRAVRARPQRARHRRRSWPCWPAGAPAVAHCPTSNSALGSGLFPLRRHVEHGVRVALGSDVGAGTGFSLFKEGLQAYFMQSLLGPAGLPLTVGPPAPPRHPRGRAGARPGRRGRRPRRSASSSTPSGSGRSPTTPSTSACGTPPRAEDALAKIFALGGDSDLAGVWVGGDRIKLARPTELTRQQFTRAVASCRNSPTRRTGLTPGQRSAARTGGVRREGEEVGELLARGRSRRTGRGRSSQWPAAKASSPTCVAEGGVLLLDDPLDQLAGDRLAGVEGGVVVDPLPDLGAGDLGGGGVLHQVVDARPRRCRRARPGGTGCRSGRSRAAPARCAHRASGRRPAGRRP